MTRRFAAILAAALAAAPTVSVAQDASYIYRYRVGGGDAQPVPGETEYITVQGSPVLQSVVGRPAAWPYAAIGGRAPYSWALFAGTLPPGMFLNASTGVVSGTFNEVGKSPVIRVRATDADGRYGTSAPFVVQVYASEDDLKAGGPGFPIGGSLNGGLIESFQPILDGDFSTGFGIVPGEELVVEYPVYETPVIAVVVDTGGNPVTVSVQTPGGRVSATLRPGGPSVTVAGPDGQSWTFTPPSSSSGTVYVRPVDSSGRSTTAKASTIRVSAPSGPVTVTEVKPAPTAPTCAPPAWVTPNGPIGSPGSSAQLEATTDLACSAAPASFHVAEGTSLPAGVSLSTTGVVTVAENADLGGMPAAPMTVTARDGIGFETPRAFDVLLDAPDASTVVATRFAGPSGALAHQNFYDGEHEISTPLGSGQAVTVDFGFKVSAQCVAIGSAGAGKVQYESAGAWTDWADVPAATRASLQAPRRIASRWRFLSTTPGALSEMRLGCGPTLPAPVWGLQDGDVAGYLRLEPNLVSLPVTTTRGPLRFTLVSGALPQGAALSSDGRLSLPGGMQATAVEFEVLIRATDAGGVSSSRTLRIIPEAALLAGYLPQTVVSDGPTVSPWPLRTAMYDGISSTRTELSPGQSVTADFVHLTEADRVALDVQGSGQFVVEGMINGAWLEVASASQYVGSLAFTSDRSPSVASVWRVRNTGGGILRVGEFRLRGAPISTLPLWQADGDYTIVLPETAQSIRMPATRMTPYSPEALTYSLATGTMPAGAAISASGDLSLPASAGLGGTGWNFSIRATDGMGGYTDQAWKILPDAYDASLALPNSSSTTGSAVNAQPWPLWATMYGAVYYRDGAVYPGDPSVRLPAGGSYEFGFAGPVAAESVTVRGSSAAWTLEALSGSAWTPVVSRSQAGTSTFDRVVASRWRITSASAQSLTGARLGSMALSGITLTTPDLPLVGGDGGTALIEASGAEALGAITTAVVAGPLPDGVTLSPSGLLTVPADLDVEQGAYWRFVVRATSALGVVADRTFMLTADPLPASVAASGVLPTSVGFDYGGATPNETYRLAIRDGDPSQVVFINSNNGLVVSYPFPVRATEITAVTSLVNGGNIRLQAMVAGRWKAVANLGSMSGTATFPLTAAQQWRIETTDGSGAYVGEFRLGSHAAAPPPTWTTTDAQAIALVGGGQAASVQLAATRQGPWSQVPLAFAIQSGALPSGATLSSSGLLTIPANAVADREEWIVVVRATDGVGSFSDRRLILRKRGALASAILPVSVNRGTVNAYYDGNTSTLVASLTINNSVDFTFSEPVTASSAFVATRLTNGGAMDVEALVNGAWTHMGRPNNLTGVINFVQTATATQWRVKYSIGSSSFRGEVYEFRLGEHPPL